MYRKDFNDHEADKVWVKQFGYADRGRDITGTIVYRNDHGQHGWHVDHIKPINSGGSNYLSNLQVLSSKENEAKSDEYPTWIDTKGRKHTQY